MEKNSVVNIASKDWVEVEITGVDQVVQKTKAQYFYRNNCHYLVYEESIEGVEQPLKSRLKFKDGFLELVRHGAMDMTLVLEKDKSYTVQYKTPTGAIDLEFLAREVNVKQVGTQITAQALYSMGQGEWKQDDCKLIVKIKRMA